VRAEAIPEGDGTVNVRGPSSKQASRQPPRRLATLSRPARSQRDVNELIASWQSERDPAVLDALVRQFMPLVRALARRYSHSSMVMEDLVQVAALGLIKAIDRFDPERGQKLQSFAIPTILGELRRHFRDSGWAAHVPRKAKERALTVRDACESLAKQTGREPTAGELAEFLEIDVEDVLEGLNALRAYDTDSLDVPMEDGEGRSLIDALSVTDPNFELVEDIAVLGPALSHLDQRQREILRLRFLEELSQSQIAARVGISQMQISRILSRCFEILRDAVDQP
jgi:RNA polymerase sigma-B factor